ncbi:hypothetical protein D3C80_1273570 [compost metagenome]
MSILQEQLVKAPSIEVCRELAVAEPESRKVTAKLRVSFQGREYDVSSVPGVMVHDKVMVTRNPWRDDAAQVVATDAAGHEVFYVVPVVERNELGFDVNAPVIGQAFKRHADTPAQEARKEAGRLAMGAETEAEAEQARKDKKIPFGGRLQPYKHIDDAQLPTFMPRRGTQHDLVAPTVEIPPLSHVEAAKALRARMGDWNTERMAWLKTNYPNGVPEEQLDAIVQQLQAPVRPSLRVVGGTE